MQETEQIGTDPIRSIYSDLGLAEEGIKYESFEATFKSNAKARESIYNDLGFKDEGITFETFESKLGFKNKPRFQYSKPFNTAPTEYVPDLLTQRSKPIPEDKGFRKVNTVPVAQPATPVVKIDDQKEFGNRLAKQQHEEQLGASYKNLLPHIAQEIPKSIYSTSGDILQTEVNKLASDSNDAVDEPIARSAEAYLKRTFGFLGELGDLNMSSPATAFKTIADKITGSLMKQSDKDHAIQQLSDTITWLDDRTKLMNDWQAANPVPENIGTNTAKTIAGMLPDIAIAGLGSGSTGAVAEKYITGLTSKAPELIAKYAPKAAALFERSITAPFTKVLAAKGAFEGGAENVNDPTLGMVKGGLHGAAEGIYMHVFGEGANRVSPYISNLIGKTGTTSEISTALANPLANAGVFGAAKAIRTPLEEGRMVTADELAHEAALGIGFSLLHAGSTFKTHSDVNKFYNNVLRTDSKGSLSRVLNENLAIVKENYRPDLDIRRLEEARDEIKEQILKNPDIEEKDILGKEGIRIQNTIDARDTIDGIIYNKKSLLDIIDASDLPPEKVDMMKAKVEALHKEFNPDEVLKSEVANKITQNRDKIKALKEMSTDDPIQNAEKEIELDAAHEEIKKDSEKLKSIIITARSPVAELTPSEHFYTVDGTKHQATGRDLSTAIIYNETGKSIPFDQVDLGRTQQERAKELKVSTEKAVEVIKPNVEQVTASSADVIQKDKIKEPVDQDVQVLEPSLEESEKPGLTSVDPKTKAIELAGGEKIADTNNEVTIPVKEVTPALLSVPEIDKITRTSTSPEPDLNKKQGYQAVLKKKFNDLYKVSPENLDTKVGEFVSTVHDYRNKNRIKSDKVYSESGTKESFNGLNYWIDSVIGLHSKSSGKSKSSSKQEITKMRSDWAKDRIPQEIKVEIEKPDSVVEPKKPTAPRKVKANPFKEEIEKISNNTETEHGAKVEHEIVSDIDLAEIGTTSNGKRVYILKDNVADYERFTKAIEKKLERIENSDFAEGSNVATERAIIDKLKLRLKDLEVKPTSFKIQTTESAKEAALLNDIEIELNESLDNINPKIQITGKNTKTIEYVNKVQPVLFKLFPGIKFKVYDTTSEYIEKTGRPALSAGSFNRKTKSIALNLELIGNRGAESTVYHEAIHPIVDAIFFNNPKALSKAIAKIGELRSEPGYADLVDHAGHYRERGKETVQIEVVTEFLTKSVDGTIDYTKLSRSAITKVKDIFNQIFELLGIPRKFSTGEDVAKLAQELKKAIELQDSSSLEFTIGKKNINSLDGKYDSILDNILSEPDAVVDISKIVVREAGSKQLKSIKGLEKELVLLVNSGVLKGEDVASINDIEKKNLLKLVKSEQARVGAAKTPGELMEEWIKH